MAERKTQTAENHAMIDPPFHYFLLPVLAIALGRSVWQLIKGINPDTIWGFVVVIAATVAVFKIRVYALKVQDRLIRLEETIRMERVLPESARPMIRELDEDQMVGLRFASDAELPALVEKTLANKWKRADIKKAIVNWRPDYYRV